MEATAVPRRVTDEEVACCICPKPVDLTKLCAIYPDGRFAHVDCYDAHWLSSGIADRIAVAGEIVGAR